MPEHDHRWCNDHGRWEYEVGPAHGAACGCVDPPPPAPVEDRRAQLEEALDRARTSAIALLAVGADSIHITVTGSMPHRDELVRLNVMQNLDVVLEPTDG